VRPLEGAGFSPEAIVQLARHIDEMARVAAKEEELNARLEASYSSKDYGYSYLCRER